MSRAELPAGAAKKIERLLDERVKLERAHLRHLDHRIRVHAAHARDVVARLGATPWRIGAHARVMRQLREIGAQLGSDVSARARAVAVSAAQLGVEHQAKAFAAIATAAIGKRVEVPELEDDDDTEAEALEHIEARTATVGTFTGQMAGQAAVGASYLETLKEVAVPAALVALTVAKAFERRARGDGERVIITELTEGAGWGGWSGRSQLAKRFPKLRKVWDATLDRRVCSTCAGLHHVVVDADEQFPGGYDDEPAHGRCRCATMPWLDDWTAALDELAIAPGPHAGIVGGVEHRLNSFGTTLGGGGDDGGGGGGNGAGNGGGSGGDRPRKRPPWVMPGDPPRGRGILTLEYGRAVDPHSFEISKMLIAQGNSVFFPSWPKTGPRVADAIINGTTKLEIKRVTGTSPNSAMNSIRRSVDRGGQARAIILDVRGTGMTRGDALHLLKVRIPNSDYVGRLDALRIIGDKGLDETWTY